MTPSRRFTRAPSSAWTGLEGRGEGDAVLSEESLQIAEGSPYSRAAPLRGTIEPLAARALAVGGLALAIWALVVAAFDVPLPKVIVEPPPGRVVSVFPGGPAWRDGVRPGDAITSLEEGATPLEWSMRTERDGIPTVSRAVFYTAELREFVPLAMVAVIIGSVGVLLLFRSVFAAAALGAMAGGLASVPMVLSGEPLASAIGGVTSVVLPGLWLAIAASFLPGTIAIGIGSVVGIAWLVARHALPEAFDLAETARALVALGLWAGAAFLVLRSPGVTSIIDRLGLPRAIDVVSLAVGAGTGLALWLVLDVPPLVVLVALAAASVTYPRLRRAIATAVDRLLLSEARQRASIEAVEEERARLARQIHDDPLQELSGAIKRLELLPGASQEAALLRDVAEHLRDVATELHPPVLEDLGLGPGLAFLAGQANDGSGAASITYAVDDEMGYELATRLHPEVELAAYRIVQEAIANAQRHSGATVITIDGSIRPGSLELRIRDDGVGLDQARIREAQRSGHLGIASMRQRAELIGAALDLRSEGPRGTAVLLRWEEK